MQKLVENPPVNHQLKPAARPVAKLARRPARASNVATTAVAVSAGSAPLARPVRKRARVNAPRAA